MQSFLDMLCFIILYKLLIIPIYQLFRALCALGVVQGKGCCWAPKELWIYFDCCAEYDCCGTTVRAPRILCTRGPRRSSHTYNLFITLAPWYWGV